MPPTASPPDPSNLLPDLDSVRAAIQEADERARLLRRLLRLGMKLGMHLTTANRLPARSAAVDADMVPPGGSRP